MRRSRPAGWEQPPAPVGNPAFRRWPRKRLPTSRSTLALDPWPASTNSAGNPWSPSRPW